jgi:hypothetical protein
MREEVKADKAYEAQAKGLHSVSTDDADRYWFIAGYMNRAEAAKEVEERYLSEYGKVKSELIEKSVEISNVCAILHLVVKGYLLAEESPDLLENAFQKAQKKLIELGE